MFGKSKNVEFSYLSNEQGNLSHGFSVGKDETKRINVAILLSPLISNFFLLYSVQIYVEV